MVLIRKRHTIQVVCRYIGRGFVVGEDESGLVPPDVHDHDVGAPGSGLISSGWLPCVASR